MTIADLALLLATGLFAGFLGGLFGIGGGIAIVPALYAVLGANGVPEEVRIKIAVGTSLATIILTSIRSAQSHFRHGNVDMDLIKGWGPFIALGAIGGAALARYLEASALTLIFGGVLFALGVHRLVTGKATAREGAMPAPSVQRGLAAGIGTLSSLMGIGGGVLSVMVLTHGGRPVHQSIGTSAGFGLFIGLPGAVGYAIAGLGDPAIGAGTLGYVSLPAFAAIALGTVTMAPVGAKTAARLSGVLLTRLFAGYMVVSAVLMIREAVL